MAVKIITGQIGSGKTEYCIAEIRKARKNAGYRCIMLVPSYYSHETEKMLVREFGGTGINGIEVTSFEKLSRELARGAEKRLSAPGKQALVCRAVELCSAELKRRHKEFDAKLISAVSRTGFLDIAASLISEMKRYMVTAEALRERAETEDNAVLKQKLEISSMLCENYDRLLSETEYCDSDEDLLRLAEVVGEAFGSGAGIWIDRFDEFLPQQLAVIDSIIRSGADVTFTFNVCPDMYDTYYGTRASIDSICSMSGAQLISLEGGMRHLEKAPDLKFLFSTWFDRDVYSGAVENAEIFEARDSYTEIEHTACRILEFVREDKCRFRDIAVICGDTQSSAHIIKAVFDEYDIPYYSDEKISLADHPIAMQILSLFDIIENNWDYSSVFEYLRSGFIYCRDERGRYRRVSDDDIDILENYVLKFGIRGKSAWSRSWNSGRKLIDEAFGREREERSAGKIDSLREFVSAPVLGFSNEMSSAENVHDYCCAVYNFIDNIGLYPGLKAELLSMAVNRATADAQRFGQIWNLILDVLDQLDTALGNTVTGAKEFGNYLRAAMTKCEIRTIPSGVDRVFIGSPDKSGPANARILFMTGAVSGTFPSENTFEGFISNSEREYLESRDIHLAPPTSKKSANQRNSVYKTLSAVTEKLCISYPVQTPDGKACRPSRTVIDIRSKLEGIRIYNDIAPKPDEEKRMYVSSPKTTMHNMLIRPVNSMLWKYVNEWFEENGDWHSRLINVGRLKNNYSNRVISLDKRYASGLYGDKVIYSATRLNTYAECPFRYFLQYGLQASPREEWELNAADTGTYAHELIRIFCEKVDSDDKLSWDTLTDEQCAELIDSFVEKTVENIKEADVNEKEKTAHIFGRMGKTVKEAVKTVRDIVESGSFITCEYEKPFELDLTKAVGVKGVIDRLDLCSHDGINEYRIVDYKTGKKEFDVADIYHGIDMQPIIYAAAVMQLYERAEISGTYYSRVCGDFARLKSSNRDAEITKQLKSNTQLSGATFVDTDSEGNILPEALERIERAEKRESGSMFFKPKKGEGIKIGGNIRSHLSGQKLIDHVTGKIIETDAEIRGGKIDIAPVKTSKKNACDYCDYSAVCKFDELLCEQREVSGKADEIWQRIEGGETDEMDS